MLWLLGEHTKQSINPKIFCTSTFAAQKPFRICFRVFINFEIADFWYYFKHFAKIHIDARKEVLQIGCG